MRNIRNLLLLVGAASVGSSVVVAEDSPIVRQLDREYARFVEGIKKHDAEVIIRLSTKDFTWKQGASAGGKTLDARASAEVMREQLKKLGPVDKFSVSLTNIKETGKSVTVTAKTNMLLTHKDQSGAVHHSEVTGVSVDTWVKSGNGWKIKRVEDVSEEVKVDGKSVTPQRTKT